MPLTEYVLSHLEANGLRLSEVHPGVYGRAFWDDVYLKDCGAYRVVVLPPEGWSEKNLVVPKYLTVRYLVDPMSLEVSTWTSTFRVGAMGYPNSGQGIVEFTQVLESRPARAVRNTFPLEFHQVFAASLAWLQIMNLPVEDGRMLRLYSPVNAN